MKKINFTDSSYIIINHDNTNTIVGNEAHEYYFNLIKQCREQGLNLCETDKIINNILLNK